MSAALTEETSLQIERAGELLATLISCWWLTQGEVFNTEAGTELTFVVLSPRVYMALEFELGWHICG